MSKNKQKKSARPRKRPRNIPADQLWFWTPEWQAKEKEADADCAAGRIKTFKSAEEAIADLRS